MKRKSRRGFTLLEMIITVVIIAVLAGVAVPMVEMTVKREKEIRLRRNLRTLRSALDEFKQFIEKNKVERDEDTYNYPETLEELVEGIEFKDKKGDEKIQKFLRRIPLDPFMNTDEWGMRSYQDKRDSTSWGGENVYDIYTKTERKALDGTYYKDW